jgi:XTP/dITP diphosphohydrolase
MQGVPEEERSARFRCLMVYMRHKQDPSPVICEGSWEGRITLQKQGENGFGYDPIFYVPTHDRCSAQLSAEQKNEISHRGQALAALAEKLNTRD